MALYNSHVHHSRVRAFGSWGGVTRTNCFNALVIVFVCLHNAKSMGREKKVCFVSAMAINCTAPVNVAVCGNGKTLPSTQPKTEQETKKKKTYPIADGKLVLNQSCVIVTKLVC